MKILKIALKNLNSLKLDTIIDFTESPLRDAGLFAIVGDTGAGKTTILDAMTLGLYGRVHRNKDEGEVLSYGAVDGHAEVEFIVKEEIYRSKWVIWRSRAKVGGKINTKRELAKWNTEKEIFEIIGDKKRDISDKVEEITGLDYERFSKSVMLSQGDFSAFLKAGDRERSNLLERITGTEIYSQISMSAFQRHKLEEQKMGELKSELDRLQILDPETLKGLKKDKKELTQESKAKQKELVNLQTQIQWRNRLTELELQKIQFTQNLDLVEEKIAAAQPDFAKLARHQQTLVFQKEITKIEGLEASQTDLIVDQKETKLAIEKFQIHKENLMQQTAEVSTQLKLFKKEKIQKEQLFEQVNALDVKIETQQVPLQKIQEEEKEIGLQVADNERNIKRFQEELVAKRELIDKINLWLKENVAFKNVGTNIPTLKNLFADWDALKAEETQFAKEAETQQQTLQKARSFLANFETQLIEKQTALTASGNQFLSKELTDRGQILEKLNEDFEELDREAKSLTQLMELNKDYLDLNKELNKYAVEIQDLENKRGMLDGRLLTAMEMTTEVQKHYDYKFQMYEREKLLANYDRERSNLKEGDKCPLCFSTTHPFREIKDYKPYVNEAEAEYLKAKKQLDFVQLESKKLYYRANDINNRIQQIIGEEGQRALTLRRIKLIEGKIAAVSPELLDKNLVHVRKGDILATKLKANRGKLAQKRKERTDLIALNQAIISQEKEIAALLQEQNAQKLKLASAEVSSKNVEQQLAKCRKKLAKLREKIEEILTPYDYSIHKFSTEEILEKLTKKEEGYEKVINRLPKETQKTAILEQNIKQATKQGRELSKRQAKVQKEVTQLQEGMSLFQSERNSLFGAQVITIVRNQLENQLEGIEASENNIKERLKNAEIQLKSEVAKAKKIEKDLSKVEKDLAKQEAQLLLKIQAKGFESVVLLKEANLPEAEVLPLENLKQELEKALTECKQSLKNSQQELDKTLAKALTTESLETLLSKKETIAEASEALQQQIGRITQQIEDNDRRKEKGKALVEKMDIQQKEYRRWAKLKEIIGSADGKVFRAFAQGLTLKKLSELANRHLLQLNGRYLIHKPNDKDLALEIVDQHQANNIRSIHTLSGGESFLVSLSLALGLSDLAGRNTQIKSLFIDEGFGTLDESALDLAISTLENLQSKGKRIGIISHVAALKDRIATQIQVQKRGSGFSDLVVV